MASTGPASAASDAVVRVENLRVTFPTMDGDVQAVKGLSFEVPAGGALGIVGESGSGKSVTSLALMGLACTGAAAPGSPAPSRWPGRTW